MKGGAELDQLTRDAEWLRTLANTIPHLLGPENARRVRQVAERCDDASRTLEGIIRDLRRDAKRQR